MSRNPTDEASLKTSLTAILVMRQCGLSAMQIAALMVRPLADVHWAMGAIINRGRSPLPLDHIPSRVWREMDGCQLGINGRTALHHWQIYQATPEVPPSGVPLAPPTNQKLVQSPSLHGYPDLPEQGREYWAHEAKNLWLLRRAK